MVVANPYADIRSEISIREEVERTLDGFYPEISKKQIAVLRTMRLDANGDKTPCSCVDAVTDEPDLDTFCPLCGGEGFYWDEVWVDLYRVEIRSSVGQSTKEELLSAGKTLTDIVSWYARYSGAITVDDKVIELIRDVEGLPMRPYKRDSLYRIGTAVDFRSDNGRLEYWKLNTYKEIRRFLNGPTT